MKTRVYDSWPHYIVGFVGLVVFGVLAGYIISMVLLGREYLVLMMACGGLSTFLVLVALMIRYPALVLTEESITYFAFGYRLDATWAEVESIGPVRSWSLHPEGLRLRACRFRVGWFPGLPYVILFQLLFPEIRSTIPLGHLTLFRSWRKTSWGREILSRVPQAALPATPKR